MFTGPLEDRVLIRELYGVYSGCAFRCDVETWLSLYAEDGVWSLSGHEARGQDQLRAQWNSVWGVIEKMGFFAGLVALNISGDAATAQCFCREIVALKGGGVRKVIGQYDDQLVRRGGRWLFARRTYTLFLDEPAPKPA